MDPARCAALLPPHGVGWTCSDGAVTAAAAAAAVASVLSTPGFQASIGWRPAGMGREDGRWVDAGVRGDEHAWLTPVWRRWREAVVGEGGGREVAPTTPVLSTLHPLFSALHAVATQLRQDPWLKAAGYDVADTEATGAVSLQVARYGSTGQRYTRHCDGFKPPGLGLTAAPLAAMVHTEEGGHSGDAAGRAGDGDGDPDSSRLTAILRQHGVSTDSVGMVRVALDRAGMLPCGEGAVGATASAPGDGGSPGATPGWHRLFTVLLYLNPEWKAEHGGCLRVYYKPPLVVSNGGGGEAVWDVSPVAGRVLIFRSGDVDHEVMPSMHDRWAITMWLYGRYRPGSPAESTFLRAQATHMAISPPRPMVVASATPPLPRGTDAVPSPLAARLAGMMESGPATVADRLRAFLGGSAQPISARDAATATTVAMESAAVTASTPTSPAMDEDGGAIFVIIPAYRDAQLPFTVADLYRKAWRPDRVYVSICVQYRHAHTLSASPLVPVPWPATFPSAPADSEVELIGPAWTACMRLLDELDDAVGSPSTRLRSHIHVTSVEDRDAAGPTWARHLAGACYHGQPFVLHLDAHMRMVAHWDDHLIQQLRAAEAEAACTRPGTPIILSTYPAAYTLRGVTPGDAHASTAAATTKPAEVLPSAAEWLAHHDAAVIECGDGGVDGSEGTGASPPIPLPLVLLPICMHPGRVGEEGFTRFVGRTMVPPSRPSAHPGGTEQASPPHWSALLHACGIASPRPGGAWLVDWRRMPRVANLAPDACPPIRQPQPALAAGLCFMRGDTFTALPPAHDLRHLFFGEEQEMTARASRLPTPPAFFAPGFTLAFHLWSRAHRPTFREHADAWTAAAQANAIKRAVATIAGLPPSG